MIYSNFRLVKSQLAKNTAVSIWNDLHYIAKGIGSPLLMNRFDYFSNFYEYKS